MNSRERVRSAARREKTDRPPTALRCTTEAWDALRAYLGVETNDDVYDALDVDFRWIYLPFIGPEELSTVTLHGEGTDYWGCVFRKIGNEFNEYFEIDRHPLANAQSVEDIERYAWPSLDWWDYSAIPKLIEKACRKEPRACMYHTGGTFETAWYMRGMETFLADLYDNPDMVDAICSRIGDYCRERAMRVIQASGHRIDVIGSGGDIGSQRGMMLSPDAWRRQIKPYAAELITPFKDMGLMTFYHSCGSIVPVIDDLIEMGLDFLDPVQVTAEGMSPEEISPSFGDRLSFHGAIDEVELLTHGSPEQVYEETLRTIDILGCHGGYIVSPTHQVQGDTSPENVVAIFRAVQDCCK